jgi:sugar phosphate isomerase/epimerase
MQFSRRHFLQTAAAVPALAGLGITSSFAAESSKVKFRLGLASYSFRNFDRAKTIEMTHRAGLKAMCFKDMHLKMDSTDEQCAAAAEECKKAGLALYGCGVVYMKKPEEVTNAFRYAKAAGMETIVAAPNVELLPQVEEKVKETGIYIAIHNHGPGDGIYPTPEAIMDKVGSLDKRIGICMDVGHTARIGANVVKSIRDYKDRIHDVHFKDETKAASDGDTCICGRGVLDLPGYLAALIEIGYDRVVSFEYEADASDPLPGLMESVGYTRGLLRLLG